MLLHFELLMCSMIEFRTFPCGDEVKMNSQRRYDCNQMSRLACGSIGSVEMQQRQLVDDGAAAGQLAGCWTIEDVWDAAENVLQG